MLEKENMTRSWQRMKNRKVIVSLETLKYLTERDERLEQLEINGVDNWGGEECMCWSGKEDLCYFCRFDDWSFPEDTDWSVIEKAEDDYWTEMALRNAIEEVK